MLRMAHRLLTQPTCERDIFGNQMPDEIVGDCSGIWSGIASGATTIVLADNVAAFYWSEATQTGWGPKDFPCIRPPFEEMMIEWGATKRDPLQQGVYVQKTEEVDGDTHASLKCLDENTRLRMLDSAAWYFSMTHFFVWGGAVHPSGYRIFSFGTADGQCTGSVVWDFMDGKGYGKHGQEPGTGMTDIPLLTLSFMNCKNVQRIDCTQSEGPKEKWFAKNNAPKVIYRMLDIGPMKQVLRTEGGSDTNGLKKALHICRGHFASYSEEKPLFGKYTGRFWKPSHVRGNIDQGAVVKDYRVKV